MPICGPIYIHTRVCVSRCLVRVLYVHMYGYIYITIDI